MNFSINTLTLLAMVLAIGLVVDDAIVVLENIHRVSYRTENIIDASISGARQVFIPVIIMSLTLAVVFLPLGFVGGLTGVLFKEFAFTLSLSVVVSGVVATILTPMMSSRLLSTIKSHSKFYEYANNFFIRSQNFYIKVLDFFITKKYIVLVFSFFSCLLCFYFFINTPKTLAPQEDKSYLGVSAFGPSDASLGYLKINNQYLEKIYNSISEMSKYFIVNTSDSAGSVSSGMILKNPDERKQTQMELAERLQKRMSDIPGLQAFVYQIPPLPMAGGGPPVQFVMTSTMDHKKLFQLAQEVVERARNSKLFAFITPNLRFDNSQFNINVNRDKASDLGVDMEQINQTLSTLWSNNYVNYFGYQGYSYQVIPQIENAFMKVEEPLQYVYLRDKSGTLIPLSSFASSANTPEPAVLNRFQQMNAITLQGVLAKGVTLGEGLNYLKQIARTVLPSQVKYDFDGESRTFIQETNKIYLLIGFALILIYLLLALQFESFIMPIVVLTSVPMSLLGALFVLYTGTATVNIYTEIGLLTLIGLISKHGILLVDFALKELNRGSTIEDAIFESARNRLRPILMTTAAMVFGVVTLIFAHGAGKYSRFDLGIVIFFGMLIGTLFTLIVVPTVLFVVLKLRNQFDRAMPKVIRY